MIDRSRIHPYSPGARTLPYAAGAGAVGLIALLVGFFVDPRQTIFSYHVAFVYFLGLTLGMLAWLLAFQAVSARWIVVVRRFLEIAASGVPLFVVLFIPVVIGMRILYPWVVLDPAASGEVLARMHHKRAWLNVPFFLLRSALYFTLFGAFALALARWSRAQDKKIDLLLSLRQRKVAAAGLPIFGISIAFAAFDWIMSLQPTFYSTIFGVYYFAGGFVGAMAVLILCAVFAERAGILPPGLVRASHHHAMGKLLFAFVCFWAYIGFSQYMLIWIGNLPEEIEYFTLRHERGWFPVFLFLVLFHFVVPFLILLSRELKRAPRRLAWMAVYLLVVHWVDTYWLVMPYRGVVQKPWPGWMIHWQDIAAFIGIGGVTIAFALLRLRGVLPVPVGDPYLPESIGYER